MVRQDQESFQVAFKNTFHFYLLLLSKLLSFGTNLWESQYKSCITYCTRKKSKIHHHPLPFNFFSRLACERYSGFPWWPFSQSNTTNTFWVNKRNECRGSTAPAVRTPAGTCRVQTSERQGSSSNASAQSCHSWRINVILYVLVNRWPSGNAYVSTNRYACLL